MQASSILVKLLLCERGSLLSVLATAAPSPAPAGSAPTGRTRRLADGTTAGADTAARRSRGWGGGGSLGPFRTRFTGLYSFFKTSVSDPEWAWLLTVLKLLIKKFRFLQFLPIKNLVLKLKFFKERRHLRPPDFWFI
jgi:hypothetical protein